MLHCGCGRDRHQAWIFLSIPTLGFVSARAVSLPMNRHRNFGHRDSRLESALAVWPVMFVASRSNGSVSARILALSDDPTTPKLQSTAFEQHRSGVPSPPI
jgi:hypothetical protein